jgi:hypothetical protein
MPTTPAATVDPAKIFKRIGVPKGEQQAVAVCFEIGLEHYYRHILDDDAQTPATGLNDGKLRRPYVLGFGAVEAVRRSSISVATRVKIVEYTANKVDVTAEYGIPHGLPIMASFLASVDQLQPGLFRSLMISAHFGGQVFDDWRTSEIRALFEWLISDDAMPASERIWWLWHICVNCEDRQTAAKLAQGLLNHPDITTKTKRLLCKVWLEDTQAGEPSAEWKAVQALLQGDVDTYVARAKDAGFTQLTDVPSRAAIEAEYDLALDALIDGTEDENDPVDSSLQLLRNTMVGPMGLVVVTPALVKRAAILSLPELGEKPLNVSQRYLSDEGDYHADIINQAVAELIRSYPSDIPTRDLKALIKRVQKSGGVATRKHFYQLGADLLGKSFLKEAKHDGSKSIRDWADKKMKAAR